MERKPSNLERADKAFFKNLHLDLDKDFLEASCGGGERMIKITIFSSFLSFFLSSRSKKKISFEISRSRQMVVVDRGLENSSIIRLPARGRYSAMIRDDNIDVTLSTWNLER